MIGIRDGESVAEHSFRTAVLGYVLATMEHVNPHPVVMMGLLNDLHEARINDLHKVGHRYLDFRAGEQAASREQLAALPPTLHQAFTRWATELREQRTRASRIARDADLLECMIQGKEYADQGHPRAMEWVTRPARLLKTRSAQALARQLRTWPSDAWWQSLVTLER